MTDVTAFRDAGKVGQIAKDGQLANVLSKLVNAVIELGIDTETNAVQFWNAPAIVVKEF